MYDANGNFVRGGYFCDGTRKRIGGRGIGFGQTGAGFRRYSGVAAGYGRGMWAQDLNNNQNVTTGDNSDINTETILKKIEELSTRIEKIEKMHGGR